ncbi:MAG: dinitrogenase iron-molybdenum cofactor biosynthesis protein [Methanobrevibacter sp.]|jgi:predicted Fe-Mo cluster-binding NifX family protein|nr:dinitrogenase iron-molybdenum cofactor biosynthesis protein [Candidatus Methanovirga meridionalis]
MSYKVAVTSDDGEYVNQHFGKASRFLIFEIDDGEYTYLGAVKNNPTCGSNSKNKSADAVALISDVSILITRNVGMKPSQILIENNIKPYISSAPIETALDEVIAIQKEKDAK